MRCDHHRILAAGAFGLLTIVSAAHGATTLHVDDDAPPGGDGLGWPTAYRFLQDALAHAAGSGGSVDEVRVAGGVYKADQDEMNPGGTGDRFATFQLLNGVALEGGYLGLSAAEGQDPNQRDVSLYETVLFGDLNGDDVIWYPVQWDNAQENTNHLVSAAGTDRSAVLDGFTLQQGSAIPDTLGSGGLLIDDGSPSIKQCRFISNGGAQGGAVRILSGQALISGCDFINNQGAEGGGLYVEGGTPTISGCQFVENIGGGVGGGVSVRGGAPHFVDCLFSANVSGRYAGAGLSNFNGNPTLERCTFTGNDAVDFGGGFLNSRLATRIRQELGCPTASDRSFRRRHWMILLCF